MPTEQLKNLISQLPAADKRGMLTENIDKEAIERTIAEIHKGGKANVLGIIDLLGEPGSEENVKPHYALHVLGNHTRVVNDEAGRRAFCEVVAKEVGNANRSREIRAYLCEELGWFGHEESVAALGNLLTDDDLSSPAAMALVSIRKGVAPQFRAAWPHAKAGSQARLDIIHGLAEAVKSDGDAASAKVFKEGLKDKDPEVRMAAAAGAANLGDGSAADALVEAAKTSKDWENFQFAKSCLVLAENLAAGGKKAEAGALYKKLVNAMQPKHIQHAAERGFAKLEGKEVPEKAPA